MQRQEVAKNILIALGLAGVLSAVVIAPGLARLLPYLSKIDYSRINQEIKRLQKRGLVEIIKNRSKVTTIKLTPRGRQLLKRYFIDNLSIEKPVKWDGKWRLIIFDIPVKKNKSRDFLRRRMKSLGFYKLQNSVFVNPYSCYEVVKYLRDYIGVSSEVEYLEVESLESQDKLIEYFFT